MVRTRIKSHNINAKIKTSSILDFFNEVYQLAKQHPKDSVLKFALSYLFNSIGEERFESVSANTLLQFALQCALYEAGCLEYCFKIVRKCEEEDFINYKVILSTLERIIQKHAPLNHSSEVSWSLWGIYELSLLGMYSGNGDSDFKLSQKTIDALLQAEDCCILTLGMHPHNMLTIFPETFNKDHLWYKILHNPSDYDDYWIY